MKRRGILAVSLCAATVRWLRAGKLAHPTQPKMTACLGMEGHWRIFVPVTVRGICWDVLDITYDLILSLLMSYFIPDIIYDIVYMISQLQIYEIICA